MKTVLYFLRHGEVDNPGHIIYGRSPYYRLSAKGREQIAKAAEKLSNKHIDFLYASPLLRTRQSAKIIQKKLKVPDISYSKYLLEVKNHHVGEQLLERHKTNVEMYTNQKPSDETLEQIAERMLAFVQRTVHQHPGKHIVAVSHGDPIMILRAALVGVPLTIKLFDKPYVERGSIVEITIEDNGEITADLL